MHVLVDVKHHRDFQRHRQQLSIHHATRDVSFEAQPVAEPQEVVGGSAGRDNLIADELSPHDS